MGLTLTMTPTGGGTVITFEASGNQFLSAGTPTGRVLLDFDPGCKVQDHKRFRVPGVDGSYLIRAGTVGRRPNVKVRYYGATPAAAEALYVADMDALVQKSYTLEHLSQSYVKCNIIPESVRRSGPIRATGRVSGQVFFDVSLAFNQDGLS